MKIFSFLKSPIQVITRPGIEQLHCRDQHTNHHTRQPLVSCSVDLCLFQTSLPLPGSDIDSTGVSDVMVTVDLAEEPVPSQFHTTVVVHSSSEPSPGLTFDEAIDVISTSTSQLSVSEEPAVTTVQELEQSREQAERDVVTSAPVVTSSSVLPSTASEAAGGAEAAAASLLDQRPRAPFGRRPRSQAAAQETASNSSPFGGGHHSSGMRSNNELAHNAVMDALFRRHSKAEAAASARRQQQEANTRTASSTNQTSGSSNSMSVSVPNLTSTMEQTVSLLETFAMVARRNLGNNSGSVMSAVTGSNNNPCSSLVRLALSSNSPGTFDTS